MKRRSAGKLPADPIESLPGKSEDSEHVVKKRKIGKKAKPALKIDVEAALLTTTVKRGRLCSVEGFAASFDPKDMGKRSAEAVELEVELLSKSQPLPPTKPNIKVMPVVEVESPTMKELKRQLIKDFMVAPPNQFDLAPGFDGQQWKARVERFFNSTSMSGKTRISILRVLINDMTVRSLFQQWLFR